jgi:glutamyl-tRNA reductase
MDMGIILLGLNHRTAPAQVRERLAFGREGAGNALLLFRQKYPEAECAIVSTCNRVEVLVNAAEDGPAVDDVVDFLSQARGIAPEQFRDHLYERSGREAVRHVLRVIGGLDSMIVGESQIVSQVKQAYALAHERNTAGPVLHRLFHHAFGVSKRIRSETGIDQGRVSIASAAMGVLRGRYGDTSSATVLVVGAGEMAQHACEYLHGTVGRLLVTTRTLANAHTLAQTCGGEGVPYAELDRYLVEADIVITATACPTAILTEQRIRRIQELRGNRPILLVDLALPRNIDPRVVEVGGVTHIDIDGVGAVVEDNRGQRLGEVAECERIIDEEVQAFERWVGEARVRPLIDQIVQDVRELANVEVRRTFNKCRDLTDAQRAEVQELIDRLIAKFLHPCLATIRQETRTRDGREAADAGTSLAEAFRSLRLNFESGPAPAPAPVRRTAALNYR